LFHYEEFILTTVEVLDSDYSANILFYFNILPIAGRSAALVASLIVEAGHYYNWLTTDWVAINA